MTNSLKESAEQADRKRTDRIWWGGVLVWVGLSLGAGALEILPKIGEDEGWWPWVLVGIGPWSLILNLYRTVSARANPTAWDWVWTVVFLLVGLSVFVDLGGGLIAAVILIGVGLVFLFKAMPGRS